MGKNGKKQFALEYHHKEIRDMKTFGFFPEGALPLRRPRNTTTAVRISSIPLLHLSQSCDVSAMASAAYLSFWLVVFRAYSATWSGTFSIKLVFEGTGSP